MDCNHGAISSDIEEIVKCESCGNFTWKHEGIRYLIPLLHIEIHKKRRYLVSARFSEQVFQFDKSFMIRSRLNADLDYLDGETKFPKLKSSKQSRNSRLKKIKSIISPYGLKLTRLSEATDLANNEPFMIHRIDTQIADLLSLKDAKINDETYSMPEKLVEKRYDEWNNLLTRGLYNPFGQTLRQEQLETIRKVLSRPGSLTIAALPTGFGKTRIAQYATYLIRKSKKYQWSNNDGDSGPTLIISPLVALMDDQRNKWNIDFGEVLKKAKDANGNPLEPLNCRFLTTADLERDPSKMEKLRNNEIDVLCCSPEDLIDPKVTRNHWLETFARMKVPFSMMVVDEAHIIGSWGSTIRPQFQLLNLVKNRLLQRNPMLRVLLMSATISLEEEVELIRLFSDNLHHEKMIEGKSSAIRTEKSATRPELYFDIRFDTNLKLDENLSKEEKIELRKQKNEERANLLLDELSEVSSSLDSKWNTKADGSKFRPDGRPSPILIYTPYPDIADQFLKPIAIKTIGFGVKNAVTTYTGKTGPTLRLSRLNRFVENDISAMIATSAFGMGVDKPDLWAVGYYGMPFSLSDLYQGFGRAARNSDWNVNYSEKSGFCLGVIFGKIRPFKPNMQIALTTERLTNMLTQEGTYFTENGYLVIDIAQGVENNVWETIISKSNNRVKKSKNEDEDKGEDDDEGNDGQTYDIVQQLQSQNHITNNSTKEVQNNFNKIFAENLARLRSIKEKFSLRLWALACLQRAGAIEVLGFHPAILFNDESEQITLKSELINSGYSGVMEQLGRQGENNFITPVNSNGQPQNRMLVVKIHEDFSDFSKLKEKIQNGLNQLKQRHTEGSNKLSEFIELAKNGKGGCFRQKFSPVVGIPEGVEKTCVEQIKYNIANKTGKLVIPCSICRTDSFISERIDSEKLMILDSQIKSALINPYVKEHQKKSDPYSLVIEKINRSEDCDYYGDLDNETYLDGNYNISKNLNSKMIKFDLIDNNDSIIGEVEVKDSIATVKTKNSILDWDCYSYIVVEKNNSYAELTDNIQ